MARVKKGDDRGERENKDSIKEINARRLDHLIDIVEKHTRTERHLEKYSNIADLDDLRHVLDIQHEREEEIDHLKNLIAFGKDEKRENNELSNLRKNYVYTQHYLEHHKDHMDEVTRQRTEEKQQHRKEQIENLMENELS